jgi:hypothetical protein
MGSNQRMALRGLEGRENADMEESARGAAAAYR